MKKAAQCLMGITLMATFAPTVAAAADDWKFAVTPYLWGSGIDATVTIKGHTAEVSRSFGDIVKKLDLAGMVNFQARKGRFGLYSDVAFIGLSDTAGVAGPAGSTILETTASIDEWIVDFGASWEVARWGVSGTDRKGIVDLYLGGRYWNIATELSAESDFFAGALSVDGTLAWVDPIVGARLAVDLSPKLQLIGRGDVGGFDIGDATSKLTWSASAYLGWRFTPLISGYAGWKYLSVEREDDENDKVDLAMSGPVLGVAFTF